MERAIEKYDGHEMNGKEIKAGYLRLKKRVDERIADRQMDRKIEKKYRKVEKKEIDRQTN